MRIHWGAVPAAADFQPEADGWNSIREPSPVLMQFMALPLGAVMGGAW